MKILFITPYTPWPAISGGAQRCVGLLDCLAREHEVGIALCHTGENVVRDFLQSGWTGGPLHCLTPDPPSFGARLAQRVYGHYKYLMQPNLKDIYRRAFLELVQREKPDVVFYFMIPAVWYTGFADGVASVFDLCDVEAAKYALSLSFEPKFKQIKRWPDLQLLKYQEADFARRSSLVLLSNQNEARHLAPGVNYKVVRNGFPFPDASDLSARASRRIVFYGLLRYTPNADGIRWFCDNVWGKIRDEAPDAVLDVVGDYPPELEYLRGIEGVELHGLVPEIRPFAQGARMLVVPLRIGGGTRVKILEAWSNSLPVVSTSLGCEGLNATDGEQLLIADDPDDFARKCLMLLENDEKCAELAKAGFEYGKSEYDWENICPDLDDALRKAVAKR